MAQLLHTLTPASAGWRYLGVQFWRLAAGDEHVVTETDRETAVVLVSGSVTVFGAGLDARVSRDGPFAAMAQLSYVPPRQAVRLTATEESVVALGTAPAEGEVGAHIVSPEQMATELRGGGPALRQVNSLLAHPVPAERLVVYDAYVPRGTWAGWPPHRHDGQEGSPYLEETYYFAFDRPSGFGYHRNYAAGLDEYATVHDGSLVAVPHGYHVSAASPAANMWILNFLAGSPHDRPRAPRFDPQESSITQDWDAGTMRLPAVTAVSRPPRPPGPDRARR